MFDRSDWIRIGVVIAVILSFVWEVTVNDRWGW